MDAGLRLGLHETFRACHGRLLNASCALDFCPATTGNCHHFYNKTSSTEVLEFNNFGHSLRFYGEMAAITYMKSEQNYSKYIFNENISQNLQPIRNNKCNIKYYWLIFTISLLFLYKQLYNRRSKVLFILQPIRNNESNIKYFWLIFIMSLLFLYKQLYNRRSKALFIIIPLVQSTIAFHSLNVASHCKPTLNTILRNFPTKEFFTMEVLRITYKINEFSACMHIKLFTIDKMKNKYNRKYLKMLLILSGDIELRAH